MSKNQKSKIKRGSMYHSTGLLFNADLEASKTFKITKVIAPCDMEGLLAIDDSKRIFTEKESDYHWHFFQFQ